MMLAVTQNTPESYWNFKKFNLLQKELLSTVVAPGVLALVGVGLLFFTPAFGVLAILLGVLYPPLLILGTRIAAKRFLKRNAEYLATGTKFVFEPGTLTVTSASPVREHCVTASFPYEELNCVYETKDAFYLFLNARRSLILPKADLVEGTPAELSALLSERLTPLKKFKRYGK